MAKLGRPTKYTEELAERICCRLANGETVAKICSDADIPDFVTIYDWVRDKPIFSQMFLRAKELAGHKHSELAYEVIFKENPHIDNMNRYDTGWVKLTALKSAAHARLAGQYNKSYNDKIAQQHITQEDAQVEI